MTKEEITKIHDISVTLEAGTSDILDMYQLKENITADALYKIEKTTTGETAGYTSLAKFPEMKDIAEAAAVFIAEQIDAVIKEKSKAVSASVDKLINKPERKAKTPSKKQTAE